MISSSFSHNLNSMEFIETHGNISQHFVQISRHWSCYLYSHHEPNSHRNPIFLSIWCCCFTRHIIHQFFFIGWTLRIIHVTMERDKERKKKFKMLIVKIFIFLLFTLSPLSFAFFCTLWIKFVLNPHFIANRTRPTTINNRGRWAVVVAMLWEKKPFRALMAASSLSATSFLSLEHKRH